jgi:molecular chaperone GrpE (heat shock protein)
MTPEEETTLRAENAALRDQVQALLAEVQELKERLASASKDSHNSSKPPVMFSYLIT